ncbi:hypothetical protein A1O1_09077 [Capronia coronata CBS 617.96]|uniref:Spc7 kinetochore protein domain-containing protein n=1 Tax=Capronia coronata CBS 617.96 TaxID=1182541 RepID=W9XMW4_9EURO|nr:uncharacterized protein A1O1_09077 [Capronia coronata CBS 617.96]EXJ78675.1 hypothetical protein A1O1_09077 [Capronia coronata CBS 617.96]
MADSATDRKAPRPKARQSIAHVPSSKISALKDNITTDIAALQAQNNVAQVMKKKSRGKSLGPGGLEALTESTGNTTKTTAPFQIKSILKPTVPLTPPKAIPTFDELRKRSTGKGRSPSRNGGEDLLIDFSTPGPSTQDAVETSLTGEDKIADPFSPIRRRMPSRSDAGSADNLERQQEEELKRQAEKQAILERRAARRKSLANRRVSFAPEATLHTWSVMELAEDSTTSSATNSTRRQSSMTAAQSPVASALSPETAAAPSTPIEEPEHQIAAESPAHQRDLHQKKRRRRSSGLSEPLLDASQDEVFSSSPSGDVIANSSPLRVEEGIESSDESDTDGDTAMSLDDGTAQTIASEDSGSSTHSSLEDRLRQAASQAGTRGIDYDEQSDDLSMELATGTVTNAFQPWARKRTADPEGSAVFDQENVNPFEVPRQATTLQQPIYPDIQEDEDQTEGMTMDVTMAVGRIVSRQSPSKKGGKSPMSRRRSSVRRRRSSAGESTCDEPMEFTMVQGGIIDVEADRTTGNTTNVRADEDITMEFTTAVGGVLGNSARRESGLSEQTDENESMDMTTAVGGILAPIEEQTEPQTDVEDEQTMAMEMTRAVGTILDQTPAGAKRATRKSGGVAIVENTVSMTPKGQPAQQTTPKSTPKSHQHMTSVASETGSPSLALKPRLSGRAQRSATRSSTTPQSKPQRSTPVKSTDRTQHGTPSKQITPLPARAEPPNKTPLSANVTHRTASPKKLFKAEIKARSSPGSVKREANLKANTLFSRDSETGQQTPSVVLQAPKIQMMRRRSSGIGLDKEGIGSPRVSEILDRRASIGESVPQFKLGNTEPRRLRLEDPKVLGHEVEAERVEEHRRESGRFIMEQEADQQQEETATLQLKGMIDAMSPKKPKTSKLKGRKSLAVGAAKGLLGKRPAELDLDDEDEADSTPKRLKMVSREGSPVKKVHLPKPPSKDETTGRLKFLHDVASTEGITPTLANASPKRKSVAPSPSSVGRYRDVEIHDDARPTSFEDKMDNVVGAIDVSTAQMEYGDDDSEQDKISLQEFLNMTNIHFIELSTTKRRHTMAQSMPSTEPQDGGDHNSTEATFVAAATTLPLLELYQHATRELKSYISTGRKIIRTIEAETLAEQPPLFREYLDARPDVKLVMDNQFRNGKANARLQSKEGWYQWRAQLVEGLRAGLEGINQGMSTDLALLDQQRTTLDGVIPQLLHEQSELERQKLSLQQRLEELNSVDQEALNDCRHQLRAANDYGLKRSALLESLREQMKGKDEAVAAAKEMKVEMLEQIAEADRVREEHKGWPAADVLAFKSKVETIEKQTGWRMLAVEEDADEPSDCGPALTIVYKDDLRLFFHPQAFQCNTAKAPRRRSGRKSASVSGPTAPISLTFAPTDEDDLEERPPQLSTEKRFFLQMIRSQLHVFAMMPKGSVASKTLLSTVSQGWDVACKVSEEIRLLNLVGITTASILSDEKLSIKVVLVLPDQGGRVDIDFTVTATILNDGAMVASTNVTANAVYGSVSDILSGAKCRKVQHALGKEVESRTLGEGACVSAVQGFRAWFQQQRQQMQMQTERSKEERAVQSKEEVKATTQAPASVSVPAVAIGDGVVVSRYAPTSALGPVTTSSSAPKRSPLAPKRSNLVQKKALPIPKQRLEKFTMQTSSHQQHQQQGVSAAAADKENFNPALPILAAGKMHDSEELVKTRLDWADKDAQMQMPMHTPMQVPKAAIPPEMQEVMMHTPIKRVGALRRSPI